MKTIRTAAIALALTAVAAVAALPTVNAGSNRMKDSFRAAAPVPTCSPTGGNDCGIYSK